MTIFLRVDCGAQYGMGHAMRMRTLAQALHAAAPTVPLVFVTTTPALLEVVGNDIDAWMTRLFQSEWEALDSIQRSCVPGDMLVCDEPASVVQWVNSMWRAKLRHTLPLVRIDAPWAEAGSCDLLVLPACHYEPETVESLDAVFGAQLLVGAEYVLLRDEVQRGISRRDKMGYPWQRGPWLLFQAGGSDPDHALPQFYSMTRALESRLADRGVQRIYAVGCAASPWPVLQPNRHDWVTGFHLHYLEHAQVFVTLWGTTVYEALALGTPTLTIARTASEAEDAACLEAATEGAVQSLGTLSGLMRETLCDRLVTLWHDTAERKRMHYASAGLFDGQGAARVAQAVLALTQKDAA